jgi:hypothetical protein
MDAKIYYLDDIKNKKEEENGEDLFYQYCDYMKFHFHELPLNFVKKMNGIKEIYDAYSKRKLPKLKLENVNSILKNVNKILEGFKNTKEADIYILPSNNKWDRFGYVVDMDNGNNIVINETYLHKILHLPLIYINNVNKKQSICTLIIDKDFSLH